MWSDKKLLVEKQYLNKQNEQYKANQYPNVEINCKQ